MDILTILFEDKDFLVLNKPSGITVNKADTTKGQETVQGWMENKYHIPDKTQNTQKTSSPESQNIRKPESADILIHRVQSESHQKTEYDIEQEFVSRGGIVHRLDKETSGILLVAKNSMSFRKLKEQFINRTVKKTYTALSHGKVVPAVGEINAPVGRLPFNRTHFGVIAGGREAKTIYKVISYYNFEIAKNKKELLSLLELNPQTGRTHQIRVHLKYLAHPIFSDELYAGRKVSRDDRKYLPRLFLHASKIQLNHPSTGKPLEFVSPLPQDLQTFLSNLQYIEIN